MNSFEPQKLNRFFFRGIANNHESNDRETKEVLEKAKKERDSGVKLQSAPKEENKEHEHIENSKAAKPIEDNPRIMEEPNPIKIEPTIETIVEPMMILKEEDDSVGEFMQEEIDEEFKF